MIELKEYNYDTKETEVIAEVSMRTIVNAVRLAEQFADLLEAVVNSYDIGRRHGEETGKHLCKIHPTLQRSLIAELLGIISELAKIDYTDARNEMAIAACKEIVAMNLDLGRFM